MQQQKYPCKMSNKYVIYILTINIWSDFKQVFLTENHVLHLRPCERRTNISEIHEKAYD